MYKVKVIVAATRPSKPSETYTDLHLEGAFLAKGGKCPIAKVKEQVGAFLTKRLTEQNPDKVFKFTISVSKLKDDFLICEDKE